MACPPSKYCYPGNTSLLGGTPKVLKLVRDAFVGVQGPATLFKIDFCDFLYGFTQHQIKQFIINPGTIGLGLDFGEATLVLIKVQWDRSAPAGSDLKLNWSFFDATDVHCITNLWIQTGTPTCPVSGIFISNMTGYAAQIDLLILSSSSDGIGMTEVIQQQQSLIDGLLYKSVRSHTKDMLAIYPPKPGASTDINITSDLNDPSMFIRISTISSVESQGRMLVIDDIQIGKLYLGFVNEEEASKTLQALQLLLANKSRHLNGCADEIRLPLPPATTAPTIQSTVAAQSGTIQVLLDGYGGILTKTVLNSLLVANVYDTFDGYILLTENNTKIFALSINAVALPMPLEINAINQTGQYKVKIEVSNSWGLSSMKEYIVNASFSSTAPPPSNLIPNEPEALWGSVYELNN